MSYDCMHDTCVGSDYIVRAEGPWGSRTFTVTFTSRKSKSTEHVIYIAEDTIFEGTEYIKCRIAAIRFTGQAAQLFRAPDGVTKNSVDVTIEDNDSKKMNISSIYTHNTCSIANNMHSC